MIFIDEMVYGILPTDTDAHQLVNPGFMPLCWKGEIKEISYMGYSAQPDLVTCKECLEWLHS